MRVHDTTLLIVDDNESNRDMLSRRLQRKGYRVLTAVDGEQALGLLDDEHVDLVLLDIMMPGMSGMEVLHTLRKTRSPVDLPVIMVTAKADSEDVVDALEEGANDYVVKPIDFPVCLARVEAQLRMRAGKGPPSAPEKVEVGTVLADRYRLDAKIGAGAFGTVYRARHLALDHGVAVKVLQTRAALSPADLNRFQREGISACRVKHPNAVSVLDFGVTPGGVPYLVMELLEGRSLEQEIARSGRIPLSRCAEIASAVCSVLAEAHRRDIVHRDIKPANIFLHRVLGQEQVKVLDFGIAKLEAGAGPSMSTQAGLIMGTPTYMAPERLRGEQGDGRSDVYSVGVTLYEMLSGRLPHPGGDIDLLAAALRRITDPPVPLSTARPRIPALVEEVVMRALRKEPAERPDAEALGAALTQAAALAREQTAAGEDTLPPGTGSIYDTPTVERPGGVWRRSRGAGPRTRLDGAPRTTVSSRPNPAPDPKAGRRGKTKKPTLLGVVLLAACLGATPVFSDTKPQEPEREEETLLEKLEEFEDFEELGLDDLLNVTISIAAGRTQTLEEAPSIVSVVTDEEIRRLGARTLEEVLETVPGIEVLTDSLGRGLIVLRGIPAGRRSSRLAAWASKLISGSSENVLVLFNGHRLNEEMSGGATIVNLDIPVDNIKKVEIIRGPGSALFGANAFLGVINIVTYTADTFRGTEVSVGVGSFDTRQASVLFGKTVGKVSLSGFAQWADTDGARLLVPTDGQTLSDQVMARRIPPASLAPSRTLDDRRTFDANASLVYKGLTLGGRFKDEDAGGYVGLAEILGRQNRLQNRQLSLYTDYRRPLGKKGDLRGSFTFMQSEERSFLDPFPPGSALTPEGGRLLRLFPDWILLDREGEPVLRVFPDGVLLDLELNSRRWGGEVRLDASVFRGNTATFGVGVEKESTLDILTSGNFDNVNRQPVPGLRPLAPILPETDRRIFSLFAQDTWNPVDRVGVTAGLRWDDYNDFGKTLNPRAAVVLRLPRDLSLKVLYGRAFRAPTFLELFSNFPGSPGNPDLEPTTINTFEVALGYRRRGLRVSANAYANYLREVILNPARDAPENQGLVNIPGADVRGVEFELSRSFGLRHALRLGYAYQDAQDRTTGRPLPDVPHHLASLGGTLAKGKHLSLTPTLLIRGGRPRPAQDSRPEMDGYSLLSLGVRVRELFEGLELSASVQNALDEEYFDPSPTNGVPGDYPRPGRKVFVKAAWKF